MDKEKIRYLPDLPGVYMMKDAAGGILYVGKAGSLKRRVSSYFRKDSGLSDRIRLMVKKVTDISYIVTSSEAEALITESAYIKRYRPRYNVALKDDKSYPYLKLTVNEDFPRLLITRKTEDAGALYYGPYTDVKLLRRALRIMKKVFPLRTCRKMPKKVCLNYHIRQCYGPCVDAISKGSYDDIVQELRLFLEGERDELIESLSTKMREASSKKHFEKAAALRDRIVALSVVPRNAGGASHPGSGAGDVEKEAGPYDEITALRFLLGLKRVPRRIEAFDISNTGGAEATGSMITFKDGRPRKSDYRKFRIRDTGGIDDYKMIREIVRRRYIRVKEEKLPCPDLIIIDGGKGHLNSALSVLKELGFERLTVIGIAKRFEHIYLKDRKEPVIFSRHSAVLHLIQRLRDEAHRFAVKYHRRLRSKRSRGSVLDGIDGIGEKRKNLLLGTFGSVENIRKAGAEGIASLKGIDKKTAERVIRKLFSASERSGSI